jgi:hypothetical protein
MKITMKKTLKLIAFIAVAAVRWTGRLSDGRLVI